MALPKLNDTPKYSMEIPSTGVEVRYRPFLVKEEKVMLLAMESQNEKDILNSILDTIEACVEGDYNLSKLTTFDIEFMFTRIRAKSVGESSEIGVSCTNCDHSNPVSIPIDKVEVSRPKEAAQVIELQPGIQLELRWPTYIELGYTPPNESQTALVFRAIRTCLGAVLTEEERIDFDNESEEDITNFIDSMNQTQFAAIQEWLESIPALSHDVNFTCAQCGTENNQVLKGMQSFF